MAVEAGDVAILRVVLVVAGGGEWELGLIIDLESRDPERTPAPYYLGSGQE